MSRYVSDRAASRAFDHAERLLRIGFVSSTSILTLGAAALAQPAPVQPAPATEIELSELSVSGEARARSLNSDLYGRGGATGPAIEYSLAGMIWVSGIHIAPSIFLMVSGTFRSMDARLEQAGTTAGATSGQIVRAVSLPLLLPGMLSAALYMFMVMIQTFDIPLTIGLSGGTYVLSTRVWIVTHPDTSLIEYGFASAYGFTMLLLGLPLLADYLDLLVEAAPDGRRNLFPDEEDDDQEDAESDYHGPSDHAECSGLGVMLGRNFGMGGRLSHWRAPWPPPHGRRRRRR